ncbi:hypothetical protein QF032_007974 [Streptomyces achromogenes]|nr:hypothetical protein [Streptomyces achromogenes]
MGRVEALWHPLPFVQVAEERARHFRYPDFASEVSGLLMRPWDRMPVVDWEKSPTVMRSTGVTQDAYVWRVQCSGVVTSGSGRLRCQGNAVAVVSACVDFRCSRSHCSVLLTCSSAAAWASETSRLARAV